MLIKRNRGPQYKRLSRRTVMGRHLYPLAELPKDIRNLIQFHFGSAHLDTENDVVEVGGRNGTKYNDMWFSYKVVRGANNSVRGVLIQDFLMPGWYNRLNGNAAHYPSIMAASLRTNPEESY